MSILRKEFLHLHRYNPIEHVGSRLKSPKSTLQKVLRLGIDPTPEAVRAHIRDIAGVRITCSFIADTYRALEALTSQTDVKVPPSRPARRRGTGPPDAWRGARTPNSPQVYRGSRARRAGHSVSRAKAGS